MISIFEGQSMKLDAVLSMLSQCCFIIDIFPNTVVGHFKICIYLFNCHILLGKKWGIKSASKTLWTSIIYSHFFVINILDKTLV